ncbi:TVP38/TMEM64 family protein [Paenibacillus sp. EC2-1]|uniref:TVP38/TMEM64 family protein n=1 Tax=Paenibacillus sp. EC2-1 TaxID=3388665 RepID=UPI003BEEE2B3
MALFTEENLSLFLEKFRSLGPIPGILLTFMKSFVPPLPTVLIVGVNAAVYGFWPGFIYSWIGLVSGCLLTFLVVRKISGSRYLDKWAAKPKVQRGMRWIQRNGFSYVFLLGILPVGPFVAVNMAAGIARMHIRSYLLAVTLGKGIMVFCVSFVGANFMEFINQPLLLLGVVAAVIVLLWISKKIEAIILRGTNTSQKSTDLTPE